MKADLELVSEVKQGSRAAFSELVKRHQRGLFRLIWRVTRDQAVAEDVVQESFVKAYQKINSFEERSSFKSWLYKIAMNTAHNSMRSSRREMISIDHVSVSAQAEGERSLIYRDLQRLVSQQLETLPERQRTALQLRIFEDLSFQEISLIMDCPYDTAKANYRHALLKMRAALADLDWVKNLNLEDDQVVILKELFLEVES